MRQFNEEDSGVAGSQLLIIVTLFGVLFLATSDNQILIPILPLIGGDLGVSIEVMGWLFSAYALAASLFNILLGPLTDRFGRVFFLQVGLILFAITALGTSLAGTYTEILILRCGAGLSAGLLSTCTASLVGDLFPYKHRGRVMGVVLSSYFAALMLGVPVGAALAQWWGWRSVFRLSLGTALLLFIMLFFFRVPVPAGQKAIREHYRSYRAFFAGRATHAGLWVSFGVSGGTLAFLTYISGYLNQAFQLSAVQISLLFLVAGLAAAIASPASGYLSDRLTKREVFLASNSFLAAPLLMVPFLAWGGLLIAVFFLVSLCIGFRQTALQTLQTELVPRPQRGAFIALRNGFSQLGISLSVFLAGILYSMFGYVAVIFLAAALTLASSLLLFFSVEEPLKQKEERHEIF